MEFDYEYIRSIAVEAAVHLPFALWLISWQVVLGIMVWVNRKDAFGVENFPICFILIAISAMLWPAWILPYVVYRTCQRRAERQEFDIPVVKMDKRA